MDVQELRPGLWRWATAHPEWEHGLHWPQIVGSVYAELPEAVAIFYLEPWHALVAGDVLVGENGGIRVPVSWFPKEEQDWVRTGLKERLRALLELDVDLVLVSHGDPVLENG